MPTYSDGDWEYNVNEIRADNRDHLIAFGDLLIAAGWTVVGSSDGTTPKAGRNSLADWNNTSAWEHFRDPGGAAGRDFVWQRSTNPGTIRAWLGRAAQPFTGGTGASVPTASGALQIIGSGGGYQANFFPTTPTNVRVHMGARSVGIGTFIDVFPFWIICRVTPSGTGNGSLAILPLVSPYEGTVGFADFEPWVAMFVAGEVSVTSALRGWYRANLAGAAQVTSLVGTTPGTFAAYSGQSPYSGEDDLAPVFVSDGTGGVAQRKGVVQDFTCENPARADLDTYNLAVAARARIQFGQLTFPWPSTVAPQF
jgi:hypothetical protein